MIELCVVKSIEQMNRSRTGRGHADADVPGELRMRAPHERGHLFVAHLHEIHVAVGAFEGAHDSVDAVARIAVDAVNAPFAGPMDEQVAYGLVRHVALQRMADGGWRIS